MDEYRDLNEMTSDEMQAELAELQGQRVLDGIPDDVREHFGDLLKAETPEETAELAAEVQRRLDARDAKRGEAGSATDAVRTAAVEAGDFQTWLERAQPADDAPEPAPAPAGPFKLPDELRYATTGDKLKAFIRERAQ